MNIISKYKIYCSIGIACLAILSVHIYSSSHNVLAFLSKFKSNSGVYTQLKSFGDLNFEATYCPPKSMAIKQRNYIKGNKNEERQLIKQYENYSNYSMKLENTKGKGLLKKMINNQGQYQELVNYLSFGIEEDLFLCTPRDTIKCSFAHFERNFDLAPFANIEIGFAQEGINKRLCHEESWVLQFDAERFGLGMLKFRFESEDVCN